MIEYKSPIEMAVNTQIERIDEAVLKAVQNVGITVDKYELKKALEYDRNQFDIGFNAGYEQASKETARDIFERVIGLARNYYPSIDHYCISEKAVCLQKIKALAKEYGVEVEE